MADFLVEYPDPTITKLYEDLPDEIAKVCLTQMSFEGQVWQLFFDGASRTGSRGDILAGVGVELVSPQNYVIPRAFSLTEPCSNNVVEYNALLIRMQITNEIGVKNLEAYGDSKLIVNQVRGEYKVRHEDLYPIITQLSTWQRGLKTSTSTMYLARKMLMQTHWHLSLPPWIFHHIFNWYPN